MFVQMFTAKVADAEAVRGLFDSWPTQRPPDVAWLGTTAGVTDDGSLVAVVRFETEQSARANSDRPEQGHWWASLERSLAGDATFFESSDVEVQLVGDLDQARFVQVMRGRVTDVDRARRVGSDDPEALSRFRPDILGSLLLAKDSGEYAMAVYFTDEDAARAGEQQQPPPEIAAQMEELNALNDGPVTFYDLRDPWLYSP
ncbi:MAG TPA: hypothetical protein VFJ97_08340 [Dermatophilaceae bacterium]|nr:hypothetical protein [Dermatophilaceae bacterium]